MFLCNLGNGHGIPGSSESDPVVLLVGSKVAESAEKFPLLQVQHLHCSSWVHGQCGKKGWEEDIQQRGRKGTTFLHSGSERELRFRPQRLFFFAH